MLKDAVFFNMNFTFTGVRSVIHCTMDTRDELTDIEDRALWVISKASLIGTITE